METFQIILCVIIADFITGIIHWWEDTYGNPKWPILGTQVVKPNILHHKDPTAFIRMTAAITRNYQVWGIGLLSIIIFYLIGVLSWELTTIVVIASQGNETHAWTHTKPPKAAKLLQDMGILITPQQHAKHHRPPFDTNYCTLTNLVNPLLETICFWKTVEWIILKTLHIKVKRGDSDRNGV